MENMDWIIVHGKTEFVTFIRVRKAVVIFLRVDYNVIISERRDCYGKHTKYFIVVCTEC